MPGLVGVIAQDTARFSMFGASLTSLQAPEGTRITWLIGHQIAASMNDLVRVCLEGDDEWLWIMGDDHVFAPNILTRLLSHDVDVVVPLCLTRMPPYKPVVFTGFAEEGSFVRRRLNPDDHPQGLVPMHSAGSAGMLVRRHVLEAIPDPWFEAGRVGSDQIGEDVYFCDKARDAGFGLFVDTGTTLGHCTTAVVWPVLEADLGWTYGFGFPGGLSMTMPPDAWEEADRIREDAFPAGTYSRPVIVEEVEAP